ncbi:hypothetical protein DERP_008054 [Dermatophagoides pteronyssinus]|uniref:Uncharacterized protein LOC113791855 n=2 Tax=Dermatophagoides pteronyssinus TaxID=6956 RepID=A0A6P6XWB9_DERPT|nr:uncharacterized protein LOC113791855 [Dermatophagoides pteronyssinus]KAH9422791.1 hypothetical protein DERP_008054 [Dermatophagoides pteronyssinus]
MNETLLQAPYVLSWNYTNSSSNLNENFDFFQLSNSTTIHNSTTISNSTAISNSTTDKEKLSITNSAVVAMLLLMALMSLVIAICCVFTIYLDLTPTNPSSKMKETTKKPTTTTTSATQKSEKTTERKRRCPAPEEIVDGYEMEAPSDPGQVFKSRKKSYEQFQQEFEMDRMKLLEKMGNGAILMKQ